MSDYQHHTFVGSLHLPIIMCVPPQAKVYEEDFKTEREDRTRAFAEREKEGERYREEIERLRIQLKSHKGNLTDLEIIHLARQRELMQAMDDLKKCQEEVQAKTSQVKQYKKQHDGLVTKVNHQLFPSRVTCDTIRTLLIHHKCKSTIESHYRTHFTVSGQEFICLKSRLFAIPRSISLLTK